MTTRCTERGQRGIILPVVLVLTALLAALALSFTSRTQVESLVMANNAETVRARALAEAGVYWATARLLQRLGHTTAFVYEEAMDFDFAGARMSVLTTNETGKVDLNAAPEALLRQLFDVLAFEDSEIDRLVDAVADWRDEDALTRLNGAEADRYASEGLPYGPGNRPFLATDELNQVLGIDRDAFTKLRPFVTVWSAQTKVYPAAAPVEVLKAIPQLNPDLVEAYIEARSAASRDTEDGGGLTGQDATAPLPTLAGADEWVTGQPGPLYRIVVFARASERGAAVVEAIVRIGQNLPQGHEILWMQDLDASAAHWIEDAEPQGGAP